jgi:hypothetical protein
MAKGDVSCRLIQASNLAYDINYGKPASQQPPAVVKAMEEIGFIAQTLQSIEIGDDACAFAETGAEGILFFRGTLPPTTVGQDHSRFLSIVKDWLNDAKVALVKGQNLPGLVHQGFLGSLDVLWPNIEAYCAASSKPLYVTGHSKGGALAFLASYRLSKTLKKPAAVYTYASPRAGDGAFAAAYDLEVPGTFRVEYRDDLVPHLPPATGAWFKILDGYKSVGAMFPLQAPHVQLDSELAKGFEEIVERLRSLLAAGFNYRSAGALQFLDWNSPPQVLPDSYSLALKRNLHLALKAAGLQFIEIIEDHFSNGGYKSGMCGAASSPPGA